MRRLLPILLAVPLAAFSQTTVPNPLSLTEALRLAESASPELQLARLKTLEAQAQARIAASALGPQLSAQSSMRYQTTNLGNIGLGTDALNAFGLGQRVGPFRVFDARPRLTQVLLDLSVRSTARAAKLSAQAANEQAAVVAEQTRYTLVQLYLRALQADARHAASASRLAIRQAILDNALATFAAGKVDKLEVTRARDALEGERLAGISATRDRDTLITLLLKTIGADNTGTVALEPLPPLSGLSTVNVADALAERPELRVLTTRGQAADAEVSAATQERLPRVDGVGDVGVLGADPARNVSTWLIGASVSIPLWTSRRVENTVQAAKIRRTAVDEQRRQTEQQIRQEVAQAQIEWEAARQALDAASRRLEATRETLHLVQMRVTAGLAPNIELITAQSAVAAASEDRDTIQFDATLASAALAHARGDSRLLLATP